MRPDTLWFYSKYQVRKDGTARAAGCVLAIDHFIQKLKKLLERVIRGIDHVSRKVKFTKNIGILRFTESKK